MKRLILVLAAIILLATVSPALSILAQPSYTPHQNPITAPDSTDPTALMLFYGNVFNLATIKTCHSAPAQEAV
jgi:hypothetical protein